MIKSYLSLKTVNKVLCFFSIFTLFSCHVATKSLSDDKEATDSAQISIDFESGKSPIKHNAAGILHSISTTEPSDEMISPLNLKNFRGRANANYLFQPGFYDRLKKIGIKHIQVVLSDSYGYPNGFAGWPDNENSLKIWEKIILDVVQKCNESKMDVEYDIWNEPDIKYFWAKDQAAWFEVWKRGYRKLKTINPHAVVAGPSLSNFNKKYLTEFLLFAKNNNCLPDILTWHELSAPNGKKIPVHVKEIKKILKVNEISINRFSINEIIPEKKHFNPAVTVSYFNGLENTDVESACRSCWNENGTNNGENRSLDGLLTHDTKDPRANWWIYKYYSEMTGFKLKTKIPDQQNETLDSIAYFDPETKKSIIMIGNISDKKIENISVALSNIPQSKGFFNTEKITADIISIPNKGTEKLESPGKFLKKELMIVDGKLSINLMTIAPGDVFIINLEIP